MVLLFVLSTISVLVLTFFGGYRLGVRHSNDHINDLLTMFDTFNATGEPIWAELNRERNYTELNRPFNE